MKLWTIKQGDWGTIGLPPLNNGEEKVDADPYKYTEEVFKTLALLQKEVVVAW